MTKRLLQPILDVLERGEVLCEVTAANMLRAAIAEVEPVDRFPMSAMSCLTNEAIRKFAKASRLLDAELPVQHFASSVAMFVLQNATPPDAEALRKELEEVKAQRDAMAQHMKRVKHCLMGANEQANGPICDTIWYSECETLFDYIDAAIAAKGGEV